jgi:hypothetical protein
VANDSVFNPKHYDRAVKNVLGPDDLFAISERFPSRPRLKRDYEREKGQNEQKADILHGGKRVKKELTGKD